MCQTILWSGQGILHEQASVTFDKREALCILMQYEIEQIYTLRIIAFLFIRMMFLLPNDYDVEIWYWSEFPYNSKFTLTSKKAWNKHCRYKVSWLYINNTFPYMTWDNPVSWLTQFVFIDPLCLHVNIGWKPAQTSFQRLIFWHFAFIIYRSLIRL